MSRGESATCEIVFAFFSFSLGERTAAWRPGEGNWLFGNPKLSRKPIFPLKTAFRRYATQVLVLDIPGLINGSRPLLLGKFNPTGNMSHEVLG